MRWKLDLEASALYVYLREGQPAEQRELDDGTIVDVDADGRLVGLEILAPWAPVDWPTLMEEFGLEPAERESLTFLIVEQIMRMGRPGRYATDTLHGLDGSTGIERPAELLQTA